MKKLLVVVFVLFGTSALAEEQNWFQKEWSEIVEFQKVNWQQGKDQLADNKLQIQNLFQKAKEYVTQD